MLHEAIDLFALVAALLGLIPLWKDPSKRIIVVAGCCLVVVASTYLVWEYLDIKGKRLEEAKQRVAEEEEREREISSAKTAIMAAACQHPQGMGFDEIYGQHIDYGSQTWEATDQAFGALVASKELSIETKTVQSWEKNRKIPLRVWVVSHPELCKELLKK